jgi:hypothetical protein
MRFNALRTQADSPVGSARFRVQLARRNQDANEIGIRVEALVDRDAMLQRRDENRTGQVDLFSLFSGASAVQEPLTRHHAWRQPLGTRSGETQERSRKSRFPRWANDQEPSLGQDAGRLQAAHLATGPQRARGVLFHPLSLRQQADGRDGPERSGGTHVFNQLEREARTQPTGESLKKQLALETNQLLWPVYDLVVEEVAVTGSDPFLRECSDVTLLFRAKQPAISTTSKSICGSP